MFDVSRSFISMALAFAMLFLSPAVVAADRDEFTYVANTDVRELAAAVGYSDKFRNRELSLVATAKGNNLTSLTVTGAAGCKILVDTKGVPSNSEMRIQGYPSGDCAILHGQIVRPVIDEHRVTLVFAKGRLELH